MAFPKEQGASAQLQRRVGVLDLAYNAAQEVAKAVGGKVVKAAASATIMEVREGVRQPLGTLNREIWELGGSVASLYTQIVALRNVASDLRWAVSLLQAESTAIPLEALAPGYEFIGLDGKACVVSLKADEDDEAFGGDASEDVTKDGAGAHEPAVMTAEAYPS